MTENNKNEKAAVNYGQVATVVEIGKLVRLKRKQLGVLQEDAAGLSGVGTKFLSQLENGKETAEIGRVLQVLKSIGLEVYIYPRSSSPLKGCQRVVRK